jgi:hypothetical protein
MSKKMTAAETIELAKIAIEFYDSMLVKAKEYPLPCDERMVRERDVFKILISIAERAGDVEEVTKWFYGVSNGMEKQQARDFIDWLLTGEGKDGGE